MIRLLALSLLLTSCGLVDDIEDVIDPEPEVIKVDHVIPVRRCAQDSVQAADSVHYAWCRPTRVEP